MPTRDEEQKSKLVRAAIAANLQPRRTAGNKTVLPAAPGSSSFVVLASSSGMLTPAGELYYSITGAQPPTRQFDPNQTPVNRGGSTFITGRDGRPLKLRFLGADGQLQLTAAGREYYKDAKDEFIVTVPVLE